MFMDVFLKLLFEVGGGGGIPEKDLHGFEGILLTGLLKFPHATYAVP